MHQRRTADYSSVLEPPETLTVRADPCGVPLQDHDIFLLILLTAGRLARLPWGGATARYGVYRTSDASDIALLVRGGYPDGGFDVKIMIWGLSVATRFMIESKCFCFRRFVLWLDDRPMGELHFRSASSGMGVEATTLEGSEDVMHGGSNISTAVAGLPLTFRINSVIGPPMSVGDIVMTLLGGFEDVGFRGIGTRIHSGHFTTSRRQYRVVFDFHVLVPPPGEAPAWFTCEITWAAMESLVKAYFLETRRRFTPVLIAMTRDRVLAGSGTFSYPLAIGTPSGGENVTTS
ncbi:MAG: hypothetical protein Q9212_007081 [Teloschistes hypoglaucus]